MGICGEAARAAGVLDSAGVADEDVLLVVDGYDCLVLSTTTAELTAAYTSFGAPIVASGCYYQWPDVSDQEAARLYRDVDLSGTYSYLCAGAYMGRADAISRMLDRIPWRTANGVDLSMNDQLAIQRYRARYPDQVVVDAHCRVFLSAGRRFDNLRFVRHGEGFRVLVFDHVPPDAEGRAVAAPPILHLENDDQPKWDYDALVSALKMADVPLSIELRLLSDTVVHGPSFDG